MDHTKDWPHRARMLLTGADLTSGDRNREYGEPEQNFENVELLWNAYLNGKYGGKIIDPLNAQLSSEDVAWMCVLMKIGRTFIGQPKEDTYIDAAVYAAIAGELAFIAKRNAEDD